MADRQLAGVFGQELRTFQADRTEDANAWRCDVGTRFRKL